MRNIFYASFIIIALLLTVTTVAGAQETWSKYPDNSQKSFMSADDFYEKVVDKNEYEEFPDEKLNVREKTTFKKINAVYEKCNIPVNAGGDGYHPNRQTYVFASLSQDGKSLITAEYDAEKEMMTGSTGGDI